MKCLSLWQPWASLLVTGRKQVETRGWPIKHRGPLLIHAAKAWNRALADLAAKDPFLSALSGLGYGWRPAGQFIAISAPSCGRKLAAPEIPFGAVIGSVDVVGCFPTSFVEHNQPVVRQLDNVLHITETENEFGDYSHGRYAFLCRNPVVFETPIPVRGLQGLFEVDHDGT